MNETTTSAPPLTEQDVEAFIITLNESEDEPACEYTHGLTICSVAVTHKSISCYSSGLVCTNADRDIKSRAIVQTCIGCKQPAYVCWHSYPI
jgi:hypothetical protein